MTDTARVLLTAGVLSLAAAAVFATRLQRLDPSDPAKIVAQLRLAQWAAIALAVLGGAPIGLAVANAGEPLAHLDLAFGLVFVVAAGFVMHREPASALRASAALFLAHALVQLAHGPGWLLPPGIAPLWFTAGSASYDVALAAACFWAARR